MGALRLAVDLQNKVLVSYLGSAGIIPGLFQSNVVTLQVQGLDATSNINSPWTLANLSTYGLRASVGQQPTGTSGGPAPLALQDTFVWNAAGSYFSADLNLAVAAVDAYIGSAAAKSAWFELNLTLAGNRITILQTQFNLMAVVDELTSTVPGPTDQYMTKAECLALFQQMVGGLGQVLLMKSANGVYGREIGVADDGSAKDNIITL
jgi:hypothetical protein